MVRLKDREYQLLSRQDKKDFKRWNTLNAIKIMQVPGLFLKVWFYISTFLMLLFLCLKDYIDNDLELLTSILKPIFICLEAIAQMALVFLVGVSVLVIISDIMQARMLKKKGYTLKFKELELKEMYNEKYKKDRKKEIKLFEFNYYNYKERAEYIGIIKASSLKEAKQIAKKKYIKNVENGDFNIREIILEEEENPILFLK